MVLLLTGAAVLLLWLIADQLRHLRRDATAARMLETFAPAVAAVQQDPKHLLAWYPLAQTSRKAFPDAFAQLDAAAGGRFPFTKEQLQAAHARWTSEWLAWERAHDAEFAVRTAEVQDEIARASGQASPLLRTRLAAVEQQKLEQYQQRYEAYIKTAKALAAFAE